MGRLNITGLLELYFLTSTHLTSFVDVGVIGAARMVHKADFIALGIMQPTQHPTFKPLKLFKVTELPEYGLDFLDMSEGQFMNDKLTSDMLMTADLDVTAQYWADPSKYHGTLN